jgi:hypothetical protein
MKRCPVCAEKIRDAVIVCRHCGGQLTADQVPQAQTATSTDAIRCEKCQRGTMAPARIRRFSQPLVFIGYTLLVPAVLLMVWTLVGVIEMSGGSSGRQVTTDPVEEAHDDAYAALKEVPSLHPDVIYEFTSTGQISETTLRRLNTSQRAEVENILRSQAIARSQPATTLTVDAREARPAGVVIVSLAIVFGVGMPFVIVGLLLTLHKYVWTCSSCGYVFDRPNLLSKATFGSTGVTCSAVIGRPSVIWFLTAGCILAWGLIAWHTRHPLYRLPANGIVWR